MTKHSQVKSSVKEITTDDINSFFDSIMQQLEDDRQSMLLGIAPEAKADLIEKYIKNDIDAVKEIHWQQVTRTVLNDLFKAYFEEVSNISTRLIKLAFKPYVTTISVFAIIKDDDKDTLNHFILTEAKLMPDFYKKGVSLRTMVFEESDLVSLPDGFKEFPRNVQS